MQEFKYSILPTFNTGMMHEWRVMFKEVTKSLWDDRFHKNDSGRGLRERINIPQTSRKHEGTFIYLCWIYMWCATLPIQHERE